MKLPCVNCLTKVICKNDYINGGKSALESKCSILRNYLGWGFVYPKVYRKRSRSVHRYFQEKKKKQFTTTIKLQGL